MVVLARSCARSALRAAQRPIALPARALCMSSAVAEQAQRSPLIVHEVETDSDAVKVTPSVLDRGSWIMSRSGAKVPSKAFRNDQVDKRTPLEAVDRTTVVELLRSQSTNLYALVSFLGKTFLIAPGDIITVPGMPDVHVGDVLHLDRIHEIGTRDYVLRAQESLWRRVHRRKQAKQLRRTAEGALLSPEERNPELEALRLRVPGSFREAKGPEGSKSLMQYALDKGLQQENSWEADAASADGIANKGSTLAALVGISPDQVELIGNRATPSEPYSSAALAGAVGEAAQPVVQVEATIVEHTHSPVWKLTRHVPRKWTRHSHHQEQYTRIRIDSIRLP